MDKVCECQFHIHPFIALFFRFHSGCPMRIYRHVKAEAPASFQDGRCGDGGSGPDPCRSPEPPWSRRPGSRAYVATRERAKRYTHLLRKGNHETLFGKGFPLPEYGLRSGPPCAECSCVDRNEFTFRVPADTADARSKRTMLRRRDGGQPETAGRMGIPSCFQ